MTQKPILSIQNHVFKGVVLVDEAKKIHLTRESLPEDSSFLQEAFRYAADHGFTIEPSPDQEGENFPESLHGWKRYDAALWDGGERLARVYYFFEGNPAHEICIFPFISAQGVPMYNVYHTTSYRRKRLSAAQWTTLSDVNQWLEDEIQQYRVKVWL